MHFYGAMFREGDVWICMEVMDTSVDKFYARAFKNGRTLPEHVLVLIAFSVVSALHYLHTQLKVSVSFTTKRGGGQSPHIYTIPSVMNILSMVTKGHGLLATFFGIYDELRVGCPHVTPNDPHIENAKKENPRVIIPL